MIMVLLITALILSVQSIIVMLGDIGGTNIRLQLAKLQLKQKIILRQSRYKTIHFKTLLTVLQQFINTPNSLYPIYAVIAIAGPVDSITNTVTMPNIQKWGQINGKVLAKELNLQWLLFMNDFEAISYALINNPYDNLISLNNLSIDVNKIRGVIGVGTGLGNSIIYPYNNKDLIISSQGGHTDFPYIDQESLQFFEYMNSKLDGQYISLQKSFCGNAINYMFNFYLQKYQNNSIFNLKNDNNQKIILQKCIQQYKNKDKKNKSLIYSSILKLIVKLYSSSIGNFISHHLCIGGIYLVGNITNILLPVLQDQTLLQHWVQRHPQMSNLINQIPIVVNTEIQLGLKGVQFKAFNLIFKQNQFNQNYDL